MHSLPDNLVAFIDNAEDRMVVEYDADYYEKKFEDPDQALRHVLGHRDALHWKVAKREYTGKSYILTFKQLWV